MNRWYATAVGILILGAVVAVRLPWGACDDTECGEGLNRFFVAFVTVMLTGLFAFFGWARGRPR